MRPRPLTALLALLLVLPGPLPAPAAVHLALPPAVAPPELLRAGTGPLTAPQRELAPGAVAADRARLDNPRTLRRYGLPVALAAVLVAGVVSLLVRLLLAEPAARRRTPDVTGPGPDATGG